MSELHRFPALCRISTPGHQPDPIFLTVLSADSPQPGIVLGEEGSRFRVVVTTMGEIALLVAEQFRFGMKVDTALELMDAIEEAIEDAEEADVVDDGRIARLQATLALFEQCLDDDEQLPQ